MKPLRVVFMGTPEFAASALVAIRAAGHQIIAVYTQPPRPAGRGRQMRRSPVHETALVRAIPVHCPISLKNEEEIAALQGLKPDVTVVAAYGLILPRAILEAPSLGCINVHASLLPRWRGAAPIQRALLEGDSQTGITIMAMEEGLDTGPILAQLAVPIEPGMDGSHLGDRLAGLGAEMIVDVLSRLEGGIEARPQPLAGVTRAPKIAKEEARLDWRQDGAQLERKVRAFSPAPGAYALIAGLRVKVLSAEIVPDAKGPPGKVLDDFLCVACGMGGLRLTRLQRPGKSAMVAADLLRGFPVAPGEILP